MSKLRADPKSNRPLNFRVSTANQILAPVAPGIGDDAKLTVAQGDGTSAIRTQLETDRIEGQFQFRRSANKDRVHGFIESLMGEPDLHDFTLLWI